MPTYERVDEHGEIVERMNLIEGSYEHTRIGLAVLENRGGWRLPPTDSAPKSGRNRPARAAED